MKIGKCGVIRLNEFFTDLSYSLEKTEDDSINGFYLKIFPGISEIEFCKDMARQKKGIDKVIHFESGYQVTIDEKKRRKDYGDILLELWSVKEKQKRGWLFTAQCDYITYILLESKKMYLLPVLLLKKAWQKNRVLWQNQYALKEARNPGYTTVNIPIPTEVLMEAMKNEIVQKID